MDLEQLEKEVEKLKKKIKLLEEKQELEKKLSELDPPVINIPSIWQFNSCVNGHDFPFPWYGTVPPTCRRCGISAQSYTITSATNATGITDLTAVGAKITL